MGSPSLREAVVCELCGREDSTPLVTKNGYRVVRCRHCDLVYVNPRLRAQALTSLYEVDSFQAHQVTRGEDTAHDTEWHQTAEYRVGLLDRIAPGKGALLDVGCSTGGFLGVAQEDGWRVTGLDVSSPSVAQARARGFEVLHSTVEDAVLADGSFQAITLFDSIEHMPSPMAALRAVHRLLASGGVVMLTTPNVDGLFPRLTWQLLGRTFGAWEHPGPPGHVYQFGKKTIGVALEHSGFETVHLETEAIALDHTVGALEDAIMGILKGQNHRPRANDAELDLDAPPPAQATAPQAVSPTTRLARRAVRTVVRGGAWLLANAIARPAPRIGEGDSLIVIARKR